STTEGVPVPIRAFVCLVTVLLFGTGIGFLAVPVYAGQYPEVRCGNAFHADYQPAIDQDTQDALTKAFARIPQQLGASPLADSCRSQIETRRWIGWPTAAVGLVAFIGAMLVRRDPAPMPK